MRKIDATTQGNGTETIEIQIAEKHQLMLPEYS